MTPSQMQVASCGDSHHAATLLLYTACTACFSNSSFFSSWWQGWGSIRAIRSRQMFVRKMTTHIFEWFILILFVNWWYLARTQIISVEIKSPSSEFYYGIESTFEECKVQFSSYLCKCKTSLNIASKLLYTWIGDRKTLPDFQCYQKVYEIPVRSTNISEYVKLCRWWWHNCFLQTRHRKIVIRDTHKQCFCTVWTALCLLYCWILVISYCSPSVLCL